MQQWINRVGGRTTKWALAASVATAAIVMLTGCASLGDGAINADLAKQSAQQEIQIRATQAVLQLTPTAIAIRDEARHRDLQYEKAVATSAIAVHVQQGLGLVVVISAAILGIGMSIKLLSIIDKRASLVTRGAGQTPLVIAGTGAQLLVHDHDKQLNPTTVIRKPTAMAQLRAALTGQDEPAILVEAPQTADPNHQLLVTGQALKATMVIAAAQHMRAIGNGQSVPAMSGAREMLAGLLDASALPEPIPTVKVIRLEAGQEDFIRRLLPRYVDAQ